MRPREIIDAIIKLPSLDPTVEAQPEDFEERRWVEAPRPPNPGKPGPLINLLFNALDWLDRITDPGMGPKEGKFREPPQPPANTPQA